MARWRTHHKRRARIARREQVQAERVDQLLSRLQIATAQNVFGYAIREFANGFAAAMQQWLEGLASLNGAFNQHVPGWKSLDARYRLPLRDEWPDVVYEDILDADLIDG
jgi:hypothetical protein